MGFSLVAECGGYTPLAAHELLIAVASLVMSAALEHRLGGRGPRDMQDLPGPGIEPVPPEVPEGFFTTELSGKPFLQYFEDFYSAVSLGNVYFPRKLLV